MLVDEATIYVKAGDGGDGCVGFRREKYVPRGGPDGGDGGKGGSIFFYVNDKIDTLMDIPPRSRIIAENGACGMSCKRNGKDGKDLIINLPRGTIVKDLKTGRILKDLSKTGDLVKIVKGGGKGKGNVHFKSATNQTPHFAEKGKKGQERWLKLELKLIADVGIIGLPNGGKSTLLSRISSAHPKIANYPFTTLQPQLGIVDLEDFRRLVFADIPGIIKDAHSGSGLGNTFLRHIERTKVVIHLIDIAAKQDPLDAYNTIRRELTLFHRGLSEKPEIVVVNKIDLLEKESLFNIVKDLTKKLSQPVYPISSVTGKNVNIMIKRAANVVFGS